MPISQIASYLKWAAIIGLVYFLYSEIKEKGELEVRIEAIAKEKNEAIAKAENMARVNREFQVIEERKNAEIEKAKKEGQRLADIIRDFEPITDADRCIDAPLPDSIVSGLREARGGL